MRQAWVLVIGGCAAATPEPTISNRATVAAGGLFTISERGVGPLHAKSEATLAALRAAFPGYDVRAANDSTLSYSVYLAGEKLIWVIPNDDGTLFNVHATSPRVDTHGRDWRVGSPFRGAALLTHCECWGDNPTCYRRGEHIAINFRRTCGELSSAHGSALRVLEGEVIQRVIWSPRPFAADELESAADP